MAEEPKGGGPADRLKLAGGGQGANGPHPNTAPLRGAPGTRPLRATEVLRVDLEKHLAQAQKLSAGLEARMELLFHSCQAANLPVPGVDSLPIKHPITPQGRKIVAYLERVLVIRPELAMKVQVAIFRFHEANEAFLDARAALKADEVTSPLLEQVKLKAYHLTGYHTEFGDDPLLAQMFPTPKPGTGDLLRPGASVPAEVMRRYRAQRELTMKKAETLLAALQPGVVRIERIVGMQAPATGMKLLEAFNPFDRADRLLAQRLKEDPKANKALTDALVLVAQLRENLKEVRQGGAYEPLHEAMGYLGQVVGVWGRHPLLGAFFTGIAHDLFLPPKATGALGEEVPGAPTSSAPTGPQPGKALGTARALGPGGRPAGGVTGPMGARGTRLLKPAEGEANKGHPGGQAQGGPQGQQARGTRALRPPDAPP